MCVVPAEADILSFDSRGKTPETAIGDRAVSPHFISPICFCFGRSAASYTTAKQRVASRSQVHCTFANVDKASGRHCYTVLYRRAS